MHKRLINFSKEEKRKERKKKKKSIVTDLIIATCFRKTVIHTSSSNLIIVAHATREQLLREIVITFYPYYNNTCSGEGTRGFVETSKFPVWNSDFFSSFAFCPFVYRDNGLLLFSCGPLRFVPRQNFVCRKCSKRLLALCMYLCSGRESTFW